MRRALGAILVPLSIVPFVAVGPVVLAAHSNFDRRHKSAPLPAPEVFLAPGEIQLYRPLPVNPGAVPVLAYHGINDSHDGWSVSQLEFARQMQMLRRMGFRALSIAQYVRLLGGDSTGLPARPILITFDDGRLDSYRGADRVLQEYGFRATMFVAPGQIRADDAQFLTWKELAAMTKSGRWDVQELAGAPPRRVAYDARGRTAPFYAVRRYTRSGGLESLADWEQRVTTDVFAGDDSLREHLPGYRALTFAVPYGDYGQLATNDPRIPRLFRAFLLRRFATIFAGGGGGYSTRAALHAVAGRFELYTKTSLYALYTWLRAHATPVGTIA
jgi:peptidoglycan/xylan/chitin deacetylase (PgdA/CDA1 family)